MLQRQSRGDARIRVGRSFQWHIPTLNRWKFMAGTVSFATDADFEFLKLHGVGEQEVRRQWSLLQEQPARPLLDRACAIGDGIEQVVPEAQEDLIAIHREATARGRWHKLVPASGAASRMFALQSPEDQRRFCECLRQFAFANQVESHLATAGNSIDKFLETSQFASLVEIVLGSSGLDFASVPKGLVPFHRYDQRSRTPFEEHLLESGVCLSDRDGKVQAHFTVSPEHRSRFEALLAEFQAAEEAATYDVTFSEQDPSTDTIGMSSSGELLRTPAGAPLLRPGGHGALLPNVQRLQADLVFMKNVDNVPHEHARDASVRWQQIIGGYLVKLQEDVHRHVRALRAGAEQSVPEALAFVRQWFPGAPVPDNEANELQRESLLRTLQRPLRVCGMVKNESEPGGGPFWVRQRDGSVTRQIVEAAEIDKEDAAQQAILRQASHFNPVFMALAMRDEEDRVWELDQFIDQDRAIITRKPVDGEMATVVERPGLWNGSMAAWNSVFVEVPMAVFSPVKNVFDLLRDEHQPRGTPTR